LAAPPAIRAWRQSLLWLLRSLYVGRMALCYFVMIRGRHAAPDLVHGAFSLALFVDLLVFLAAFFEYFPDGRRVELADCWLRPLAQAVVVAVGLAWSPVPGASLGWARGAGGPLLLALEFVLLPLLALRLVRAVGRPGERQREAVP
jgi:hypothetical protein